MVEITGNKFNGFVAILLRNLGHLSARAQLVRCASHCVDGKNNRLLLLIHESFHFLDHNGTQSSVFSQKERATIVAVVTIMTTTNLY